MLAYRAVGPKTTDLQIRGIPVKTRDSLRRKAQSKGITMSQYLIDLIRRDVDKMDLDEWIEMMRKRPRSGITSDEAQQALRESRAERDAHWDKHFGSTETPER